MDFLTPQWKESDVALPALLLNDAAIQKEIQAFFSYGNGPFIYIFRFFDGFDLRETLSIKVPQIMKSV